MLKIYKASAGSGKTHTLTNDYITLLFDNPNLNEYCKKQIRNDKFSKILAITFTNKAAGEIKERIIGRLDNIRKGKDKELINLLAEKYKFDIKTIKQCADHILKSILSGYSYFSVGTIDSFFQKLLKNFALELKINTNYKIELDIEKTVNDIVEIFFTQLPENETLQQKITDFAIAKMYENKDWDIRRNFKSIVSEFFKEKNFEHIEKARLRKTKNSLNFVNFIELEFSALSNEVKDIAKEIFLFFEKNQPPARSQAKSFYTYTKEILNNIKLEPKTKGILKFFNYEKDDITDKYPEIENKLIELRNFYNIKRKYFNTLKLIRENITFFSLTAEITRVLAEFKKENNLILITEIPVFLRQIMTKNDIPFIYERFGSIIQNIMIDEFQDTSEFQWNNFIPLIEESVSNNNLSLIVGDAKQSLYRWRNGDYRLLLYDVERRFSDYIRSHSLSNNWRSKKNIVEFNNKLFEILPHRLFENFLENISDDWDSTLTDLSNDLEKAYEDVRQIPKRNEQGYVEITFFEDEKSATKEIANNILFEKIEDILKRFAPGDIAILVRKNSEATEIYNALTAFFKQKNIEANIITDRSLALENSNAVRLLISAMQFIANPSDKFYLQAVAYLFNSLYNNELNLTELLGTPEKFLPKSFAEQLSNLKNESLYNLVEKLTSIFDLSSLKDELPFLRGFQELVWDFSVEEINDLNEFLKSWEKGAFENKTIDLSENMDAIKIMTVHKSKGLSFKVVIVPYLKWDLGFGTNQPVVWATLDIPDEKEIEKFSGLKKLIDFYVFPVKLKSEALNSYFSSEYYSELQMNYMDALNVLYVAFTRPAEELYAIVPVSKKTWKNKSKNYKTINDMLFKILEENFEVQTKGTDLVYSDGKKQIGHPHKINNYFVLEKLPAFDWTKKISIKTKGHDFFVEKINYVGEAVNYGNIMHELLASVTSLQQATDYAENLYAEGKIDFGLKEKIKKHLERIFENETVKDWFSDKWIVKTEESILTATGEIKRPDRILISDKEIKIIDYKFGEKHPEHVLQVKEYMDLVKKMHPDKKITGFLYYASDNIILEVN